MPSRIRPAYPRSASRRRLAPAFALLAGLLVLTAAGGTARAAWYDDLDLTLLPRGPEEPLRLTVPGTVPQIGGRLQPYFSLGSHGLVDEPAEDPTSRFHSLTDPALRLDLGAGVTVRLFDRLHLFGEYRFFQSRPTGPAIEGPRRESDGPTLRGGFAITF